MESSHSDDRKVRKRACTYFLLISEVLTGVLLDLNNYNLVKRVRSLVDLQVKVFMIHAPQVK